MKTVIACNEAPAAIGPYSHAVKAGQFIFVSGQLPSDPKTGSIVSPDVKEQADQVLKNLSAILKTAGVGMEAVVKTTVYLYDIKDFGSVNEIYSRYFAKNPPARVALQVSSLPMNAKVEIDAIAMKE